MANQKITETCLFCGGSSPSCDHCGLTRKLAPYDIEMPSGVFLSCEVLEELDTTEYNALTATKKDGVKMLLMCGMVNLNDGKAGKTRLWDWFGAESTTVAALQALIDG